MPISAREHLGLRFFGMDPEFEIMVDGVERNASQFLGIDSCVDKVIDEEYGSVGIDGASAACEFRIHPETDMQVMMMNFRKLFRDFRGEYPDAGLSIKGDQYALGAHFHFSFERRPPDQEIERFVKVLDWGLGKILLPLSGEARRRQDYYSLSAWRPEHYSDGLNGFEYRTLPSAIFSDPDVFIDITKIMKVLAIQYWEGPGVSIEQNELAGMASWEQLIDLSLPDEKRLQDLVYKYHTRPFDVIETWKIDNMIREEVVEQERQREERRRAERERQARAAATVVVPTPPTPVTPRVVDPTPNGFQNLGNGITLGEYGAGFYNGGLRDFLTNQLSRLQVMSEHPITIRMFQFGSSVPHEIRATFAYEGRYFLPRSRMPSFTLTSGAWHGPTEPGVLYFGMDDRLNLNTTSRWDEVFNGLRLVLWTIKQRGRVRMNDNGTINRVENPPQEVANESTIEQGGGAEAHPDTDPATGTDPF